MTTVAPTATNSVCHDSRPRCEVVTDFSRLEKIAHHWQRWIRTNPRADAFQDWHWARALWKSYAGSAALWAFVVYREEKVLGVLPLVRRGKALEFLGTPESDYNDLICEDGAEATVLQSALETLLRVPADWDTVVLDHLPAYSRIMSTLPSLAPRLRKHLQLVVSHPAPTLMLGGEKTEILNRLIDKDQLKRYEKKLQKSGRLVFRHIETAEEARRHLKQFFRMHVARWAMNGIRSQFLLPERRGFYETLIEECDLRTYLRFGVLELDSQPIAYHLGLQFNGKLTWYKPTFDVDHWSEHPGNVLLRHLLRYAREAEVGEFDFALGDEPYKYHFANRVKQNYVLYIERRPARVRSCFNRAVRYAAGVLRRKPAVKGLLRDGVGGANSAWRYIRRLASGGGLWRRCAMTVRTVCREIFWARDEALLFCRPAHLAAKTSGVQVAPASLASLAVLSAENPESLGVARLSESRQRLKRGDRAFIGRGASSEPMVFWVSRQSELVVQELGPACRVPLPAPALVLYECWTPPHSGKRAAPAEYLRALAACCSGGDLWTYCVGRRGSNHEAIAGAGFQLRYRLSHRALLHWFRRISIGPAQPLSPPQGVFGTH